MEDYRQLGNKYLKQNKKRVAITIIGCMIVAACLYAFLNFECNWIENERLEIRKTDDYEILILTEDKDKLEAIINEDFVTSAYMGKAYSWEHTEISNEAVNESNTSSETEESTPATDIYSNALHINVNNIFLVKHYEKYIRDTYNVKTDLNYSLLWTYCIDEPGTEGLEAGYLILLLGIAISYIFALIGVGIIRNSVQLSSLERVKDYGNLRCIGATKKQVRAIVFRESFFMETTGIVLGIFLGYLISIPFCYRKDYPLSFHILPIIYVCFSFYFDMYFAVGDSIKQVLKVSPVEAVKGNYRIKNKKIRKRHSGIWKLIFGIEGDYAYKNIKRNNGRFIKTVFSMAFGLGTVVVIGGILGVFMEYIKNLNDVFGYYQQYIMALDTGLYTSDEVKAELYSPEALRIISNTKVVEKIQYVYDDTLYTVENNWIEDHMDEDYRKRGEGKYQIDFYNKLIEKVGEDNWEEATIKYNNMMKDYRESGKGLVDYEGLAESVRNSNNPEGIIAQEVTNLDSKSIGIVGYDEEDYSRYKSCLVDGTTELSENGILVINQGESFVYNDEEDDSDYIYAIPDKDIFKFSDLKVGDEIIIVDPIELSKRIQAEKKNADAYQDKVRKLSAEWEKEHKDELDENGEPLQNPYFNADMDVRNIFYFKKWIYESARQQLVEEGKYKTLVVEGIVQGDPNRAEGVISIVVPLDRFFEITGKTEKDYVGFQFHIGNIFSKDLTNEEFINAINEKDYVDDNGYTIMADGRSPYIDMINELVDGMKQFLTVGMIIIIVILISTFNTMNAAISNLQLRKNEFAQLRAIGMTKRGLLKTVILEGGIVWIISSFLGISIGLVIEFLLHKYIMIYLVRSDMNIAWIPILIAMILEFAVLCGTNIICFRDMELNVANELIRSGE